MQFSNFTSGCFQCAENPVLYQDMERDTRLCNSLAISDVEICSFKNISHSVVPNYRATTTVCGWHVM